MAKAHRIVPHHMAEWVNRFLDEIARDVPVIRHERVRSAPNSGIPEGNWFYFELTPVSEYPDRVAQVLSDIINTDLDFEIGRNGCVLPLATGAPRKCVLTDKDKEIIPLIKPEVFRMAMWEGTHDVRWEFLNYPVLFALGPEINHDAFPYHPHLNPVVMSQGIYLPQTLCYEKNFSELGANKYDRAITAYIRMCIWLFRHQVWIYRRGGRLHRWPGAEEKTDMRQIDGCKQLNLQYGRYTARTQDNIKSLFGV